MPNVDELLARHGLAGPATLLPQQGVATHAWATDRWVVKISRTEHRDQVLTEAMVAPIARAAGVRTPALVAWAHDGEGSYSIWERVDGEPLDERSDAAIWREVGRQLALVHAIERCDDPHGLLNKPYKRDARPYLHALAPERAAWFARWLDRLERAPAGAPRLVHHDVQGMNVMCAAAGATLIDWGDAAWFDPAIDFASIPMHHVPDALCGYEERASLGPGAEGRILRAVIGQAVRKEVVSGWLGPMDDLMRFVTTEAPARWRDWVVLA